MEINILERLKKIEADVAQSLDLQTRQEDILERIEKKVDSILLVDDQVLNQLQGPTLVLQLGQPQPK
jgi:hypothetical protein